MSGVKTEDEDLFVQHKYRQEATQRALAADVGKAQGLRRNAMSATIEAPATTAFTLQDAQQFLYREARALDDRDWDAWLAFYASDIEFWMPSWDDDDRLVEDPQTEISLIWYGHKGGLEDRVFRIRTERSSATSLPEPRTSHNISNIEILEQAADLTKLRFNWVTFSYRHKTVDTYFGTSFYTIDTTGALPLIRRKRVVLKNDYIHHVVDIYHI